MQYRFVLLLCGAGLCLATSASPASENDSITADLARLHMASLPNDSTGLINFFRLRAQGEPSPEKLSQLIEGLKSNTPAVRQQACMELVAIGKPALLLLQKTVTRKDSGLAQRCLDAIENDDGVLAIAAARVLAHRRASGTAKVLLAYLPQAENQTVIEELNQALGTIAYAKGIANPTIVAALSDKHPLRRTSAIDALAQGDITQNRDALRKLLHDPEAAVRLHAAMALAQAADPEAVTTLIALLGDIAGKQASNAEEFLINLVGDMGPQVRLGLDQKAFPEVREAWAKWWQSFDSTKLLEELKNRTISDAERENIQDLIQKLGADSFRVRQKAQETLIHRGLPILPLIKQALKDPDAEIRSRVRDCLAAIEREKDKSPLLSPASARLISLFKPQGAAEAILACLPSLEDDELIEELQYALNAIALADAKSLPTILQALSDKAGVRRAAAARALCAGGRAEHVEAVHRLLNDPDLNVRLKAALALAHARDNRAVPVLIALVAELPAEQALQAKSYLNRLAGDTKPQGLPEGEADRKEQSTIWSRWWESHKSKVAMLDPFGPTLRDRFQNTLQGSFHGYTLLIQNNNSITELDAQGKRRWTLAGLANLYDAQVLSDQRILITEANMRVTERNLRGDILWEKRIGGIIGAQRLRNGNTFIICHNRFIEVNRAGKEVLTIQRPNGIRAARKLANGRISVYEGGQLTQLDPKGRELKVARIDAGGGGHNEILDNGHALILSPGNGNLIEFDTDGNEVGRFDLQGSNHAWRLPNGHTLLTLQDGTRYLELDKNWKQVKETQLNTPATRVKRR